jgi:hypothetical protein
MHEEKIINELIEIAYKSIQRTKGAEYAPNVHEIQLCINQYVANKLSQKLEEPKQQTAIEWLIEKVEDFIGLIPTDTIEQAKEMERKQQERMKGESKIHWKTTLVNLKNK